MVSWARWTKDGAYIGNSQEFFVKGEKDFAVVLQSKFGQMAIDDGVLPQ
jgi:hypothetical protein